MNTADVASNKAIALAAILEGFSRLDAREAADLADIFLETASKAMKRHLLSKQMH